MYLADSYRSPREQMSVSKTINQRSSIEDPDSLDKANCTCISVIILLYEKFLQFDWLRAVVFHLNLKYLHVKITNLLPIVV